MKKVAYIRTSTGKQTLGIEVQKEALKAYNPLKKLVVVKRTESS